MLQRMVGRARRLRNRPGVFPTGASAPGGRAVPSFTPGATLRIIIPKRPYLAPVFKRNIGKYKRIVHNKFVMLCKKNNVWNTP